MSRLLTNTSRRLMLMKSTSYQKIRKSRFSRLACNITNSSLRNRSVFDATTYSKFVGIISVRYQSTTGTMLAENITNIPGASTEPQIEEVVKNQITETISEQAAEQVTKQVAENVAATVTQNALLSEIPDLPKIPESITALTVNGEPTLESIGLGGYFPIGWVQHALNALHTYCGLPWWAAIGVGTLCVRFALFPLVIKVQRNSSKMNEYLPQMQKMQSKMMKARQNGDEYETAACAQELSKFMKDKHINPLKNMGLVMLQFPVFLSFIIGLRRMAEAPVESMKEGGLWWFTDLTVYDPYYTLPLATCLTMYVSMEYSIMVNHGTNMGLVSYFMRAIPIVTFPIILHFPAAMLCYWYSTNVITFLQICFLRITAVRAWFDMPPIVVHKPEDLPMKPKGFKKELDETWTNWKITKKVEDRERADAVQFNKAGKGPLKKTFKYDPTKNPPTAAQILTKKR
ncbi:OXA1L mitochondrial inner membrane protein [Megalopta genalis]|uniref:OXA1L mitochondrial inner membrane protein n=1 Tax=Megalopta genalis TaxID=115081 RepID=UPI003FD2883E